MRLLIFVLFGFYVVSHAAAQDLTPNEPSYGSLDLIYSQKFYKNSALNGSVNNLGDSEFGKPISSIGIGITTLFLLNRKYIYNGTISLSHVLPQKINIYDTIVGRVSGFNFGMTLIGYDFFRKTKGIDLLTGAGFHTGRIRLFGDSRLEQVNAYFAPFFSFAPRFTLRKIVFQARVEYELDITGSKWRNVWFSTSPKVDLGKMRSTGLTTSFSIGLAF